MAMSEYVRQLREKVGRGLLFWPSAACVIRDAEDRILFVQHVEGHWTLPAGAMDPGETPADAARRETREEASVDVELLGIAGVFGGYPDFHGLYENGDEAAWVTVVFDARIAQGEPAPGDDETADVAWATVDDAFDMDLSPSTRHILSSLRDGHAFDQ